ncbi:MAG TPA: hypothetical protein VHZ95_18105, partial [Polyangiales bacterium]|nr:hypothetical protein [Polyangiales bacterium]
ASPDARKAGAAACRTLLATLENGHLQPPPPAAPEMPTAQGIASALVALRGVPPEQLLDLAIKQLRSKLPAGATVQPVAPIKFHIIPVSPTVSPTAVKPTP